MRGRLTYQIGGVNPPAAEFCNNAYLRANRLAISVFDTYDDIVDRCCDAWNAFANDPERVRSIATREYAKAVNA